MDENEVYAVIRVASDQPDANGDIWPAHLLKETADVYDHGLYFETLPSGEDALVYRGPKLPVREEDAVRR